MSVFCIAHRHYTVLYVYIPLMQKDTNFSSVAQIKIHNFNADVSVYTRLVGEFPLVLAFIFILALHNTPTIKEKMKYEELKKK